MVIDTSAIFAAIAGEPDGEFYREAIKKAPLRIISAVTLLEVRIVLFARLGSDALATFDELIERARIVVVPFDQEHSESAFDAFRRYGKGQGGPAQLNIVDCAAYALASTRGLPLLFKGNDFSATDVTPALMLGS
jgi:ribonuclease VapC